MGDNNNAGAGEDQKINAGAENGADNQDDKSKDGGAAGEDKGAGTADDDNAGNGDGADDDGADGDKSKDGKPDDDKSKSKPTPKADEEPKSRKRNIDFILERKDRKIKELQNKGKDGGADQGDDEDEIDADDAKIITKQVQKVLSPFIEKQMRDEDVAEINDFVTQNPDFKPYADKVAKFAQHESRKNIPIEALFYEVAGKDLMKIGAARQKKADDEAKETAAGGGSGDGAPAEKSVWDLTPEEFAAKQQEIRQKPRE